MCLVFCLVLLPVALYIAPSSPFECGPLDDVACTLYVMPPPSSNTKVKLFTQFGTACPSFGGEDSPALKVRRGVGAPPRTVLLLMLGGGGTT